MRFPRVSGDEPGFIKPELAGPMFSPREWGLAPRGMARGPHPPVFPA